MSEADITLALKQQKGSSAKQTPSDANELTVTEEDLLTPPHLQGTRLQPLTCGQNERGGGAGVSANFSRFHPAKVTGRAGS